jgi:hypothetical protein
MEIIIIARESGGKVENKVMEDNRIIEIRLMWIPGIRPVNVPARTPINNEIKKSAI